MGCHDIFLRGLSITHLYHELETRYLLMMPVVAANLFWSGIFLCLLVVLSWSHVPVLGWLVPVRGQSLIEGEIGDWADACVRAYSM